LFSSLIACSEKVTWNMVEGRGELLQIAGRGNAFFSDGPGQRWAVR
jgi:hypothetical protein